MIGNTLVKKSTQFLENSSLEKAPLFSPDFEQGGFFKNHKMFDFIQAQMICSAQK